MPANDDIARPVEPARTERRLQRAKLHPSAMSSSYVRRRRLIDLVDIAVSSPLTVICAPAGAGKTTLAAGWVAERSLPIAWVTLDELDHDPSRFWTSVVTALREVVPESGLRAIAGLGDGGTLSNTVDALVEGLSRRNSVPTVLVIDDLHLVDTAPQVVSSLNRFLERLPGWLHVVCLSRRDLRAVGEQLRHEGQVAGLDFADLRFTDEEAREFMSRLGWPQSRYRITQVARRVDGWAAGLRLATLSARADRARPDRPNPMRSYDVLARNYVLSEVLANEPAELVAALTAVAVVPQVSVELARMLTGRSDADELLALAAQRGLFVTQLAARSAFEIHAVVRAALVAEMVEREPLRLCRLHAVAARWFEQHGEVDAALEHWLGAKQPREALRLLASQHVDLYYSGRAGAIKRSLAVIGSLATVTDFDSLIEYAWCHLCVDQRRFRYLVEEADWQGAGSPPTELAGARLRMLRSAAATMTGSWTRGGSQARRTIRQLSDRSSRDPISRYGWNVVARDIALSERWHDDREDVREVRLALRDHSASLLALEGTRAVGHALAGRPLDALRVCAGVRRASSVAAVLTLRAELAIAEALAHYEIGDHAQAVVELGDLTEGFADSMPNSRVLAHVWLVQAHLDGDDLETAELAYRQAESLVNSESPGTDARDWLLRVGAQLALLQGDDLAALRRAQDIRDPFWRGVSAARVHLGRDAGAASATLMTIEPRCSRHEVVLGLLRARAAQDHAAALRFAMSAVDHALEASMVQTIASEGPEAVALAEAVAWHAPRSWLERLHRASGIPDGGPGRATRVEPLSMREVEVLRLLPSRLTTREIADELFISINTLKFHLKVIYRKLGVSSRADAADVARDRARSAS